LRFEEIAAELDTDAASLRAALHSIRDDGRIWVDGKARATKYTAVGRGKGAVGGRGAGDAGRSGAD
jgi:hypothetical protein